MKIFVTGANFGNKGAQSMLFTTVSEIRRRFPGAQIFFGHAGKTPCLQDKFLFDEIYWHRKFFRISAEGIQCNTPPPHGHLPKKFLTR